MPVGAPVVHRRRLTAVLLAATAAVPTAISGCGGSGTSVGDTDPATIVPASSFVYGDLTVRPSGAQKDSAQAVFSRLLNTPDPGTRIADTLDKALKQSAKGVTYAKDIKPWLGRRVGFALTGASGGATGVGTGTPLALLLDSRDDATAKSFIDRTNSGPNRDYRGITYRASGDAVVGIVHHVVVDAPEAIFKQVVDTASGGPALASDAAFQRGRTASSSRGQALVNVSVSLAALLNSPALAGNAQQLDAVRRAIDPSQPVTFSLDALPNAIAMEFTARPSAQAVGAGGVGAGGVGAGNGTRASALLAALPAESWLAFAIPHVGTTIAGALGRLPPQVQPQLSAALATLRRKTGLDLQRDVLPALGNTAVFASGTQIAGLATGSPNPADLALGLVSQPTSAAAAQRTIARVHALLRSQHKTAITPAPGGFAARSRANAGAPGILVEQRGDRLAVGIGQRTEDALLTPAHGPTLGSSPAFAAAQQALGAGLSPAFFLSFSPVLQIAQISSTTQSASYQRAQPYLRKLDYFVVGSGRREGLAVTRLVLGIMR